MEEKLIDLNEVARMMSMHPKSARKIIKKEELQFGVVMITWAWAKAMSF